MCDWAEVYDTRFRRARQDHQCDECRRKIKDGERYEYHTGKFDGRWFELVRTKWGGDLECGYAYVGQLFETIDERFQDSRPNGLLRPDKEDRDLTPGDRLRARCRRDEFRTFDEMERLFPPAEAELPI